MAKSSSEPSDVAVPTWIEEIVTEAGKTEPEHLRAVRPDLPRTEVVERLCDEALRQARSDLGRAESLAQAANVLAEEIGDARSRALAEKAVGHAHYLAGRYDQALEHYRRCQRLFRQCGDEVGAAMSLSGGSLQVLILQGRYREATADLAVARRTLTRHGDPLLLARLTSNEANILMRQDRHREAIERYRSVLPEFRRSGRPQDVAAALSNIAVCAVFVNEFAAGLDAYRELSSYCATHEMPLLALRADYNIAYLYFFRGEYTRAIDAYQETRRRCEELGDPYHLALCDLDQAEIYLELNLADEGSRLAGHALDAFEALGSPYEAAKAVAFLAIAAHQTHDPATALKLFGQAQERFAREGNRVWAALISFYQGLVLLEEGRTEPGRYRAEEALVFFRGEGWPSRTLLCELLLASIDLREGDFQSALERARSALRRLEELDLPAIRFRAHLVLGQVQEALGREADALATYRRAHETLESLRSHLRSEELKIAFLADKLEVFESLVWLILRKSPDERAARAAFTFVENAKSRSLADMIAFRATALAPTTSTESRLVERMRHEREELNSHYRRLGAVQTRAAGGLDLERREARLRDELIERSRACEDRLIGTLNELRARDSEFASLQSATTLDLETIQQSLPEDAVLLEYFEARGVIYAFVLTSTSLRVEPVGDGHVVRKALEQFLLQMSKFRVGPAYVAEFEDLIQRSTDAALRTLHRQLLTPIAARLDAEHLILVPHGILHRVPFHALLDGDRALVDRLPISYAPSASVFAMCNAKAPGSTGAPLLLGVPDRLAPQIAEEIDAVARALPGCLRLVGADATEGRLRREGRTAQTIHIATHGMFRSDNPMFSAIQLGRSRLTLFDLYDLELGADLVVLSGCGTGLHVVANGDELIGLTRGLLYAGARSVLVTLWDVHDRSTALFMQHLYRHLDGEPNRARAVRTAMLELRREHPSPYYWAPFILIGKPFAEAGKRSTSTDSDEGISRPLPAHPRWNEGSQNDQDAGGPRRKP